MEIDEIYVKREIWYPVCGYEDLYEVSNIGRIRSFDRILMINGIKVKRKGRMIRMYSSPNYLTVGLTKDKIQKNKNSAFLGSCSIYW